MIKISRNMLFIKWIEPIWVCVILSWFIVQALINQSYLHEPKRLIIPVGLLLFGLWLYIEMVWGMVDAVYDHSDRKFLLIRNGTRTSNILYLNIKEIEFIANQVPKKVILHLVQADKNFGQQIFFAPIPSSWFWSERNEIVEELIEKVIAHKENK